MKADLLPQCLSTKVLRWKEFKETQHQNKPVDVLSLFASHYLPAIMDQQQPPSSAIGPFEKYNPNFDLQIDDLV